MEEEELVAQIVIKTAVILRSQEGTGSRSQVERTSENMETGAGTFVDLIVGGGCFILMASDFLHEA